MTIKEIYEQAKIKKMENAEVRIQYRDDGGEYIGYDKEPYMLFFKEENAILL